MTNLFDGSQFFTQKAELENVIGNKLTDKEYLDLVNNKEFIINRVNNITNGLKKIDFKNISQKKREPPKIKSVEKPSKSSESSESSESSKSSESSESDRPRHDSFSSRPRRIYDDSSNYNNSSKFSFKPSRDSSSFKPAPSSSSNQIERSIKLIDNIISQGEQLHTDTNNKDAIMLNMLEMLDIFVENEQSAIEKLNTQINKESPLFIQDVDSFSKEISPLVRVERSSERRANSESQQPYSHNRALPKLKRKLD